MMTVMMMTVMMMTVMMMTVMMMMMMEVIENPHGAKKERTSQQQFSVMVLIDVAESGRIATWW
jgi:hypothetical protein